MHSVLGPQTLNLCSKSAGAAATHAPPQRSTNAHPRLHRPTPTLCKPPDILSLQEIDIGCDRSGGKDTFREIAAALRLNGLFACEFQEMRSPLRDARSQGGGAHGNAGAARGWGAWWAGRAFQRTRLSVSLGPQATISCIPCVLQRALHA